MDPVLLQEYSTILASLDEFDVGQLPSLMERHQYETFGEEGWDLPYRYNTIQEMLQQTDSTDKFIKDIVAEEEPSRYPILPGYEELRELQINHAIDHGYYKEPVYAICVRCGSRYKHFKYYRFLVDNTRLSIDSRRAARIMNYPSMKDCCQDPNAEMDYVDEWGNSATESPIIMNRYSPSSDQRWSDYERTVLYYAMSKNMNINRLLELQSIREGDTGRIIEEYQPPMLEEESRLQVQQWIDEGNYERTTRNPPILRWIRYNDVNNLQHDRMCVYLKACTACGHPTIYAYAYYLLARLNVDKESLFRDFEILMPCCRTTFMSPTFKPLPYDPDEREDFYEGLGIKYHKDRVNTKTYDVSANQSVLVKRMDRSDVRRRETTEAPNRHITTPEEGL